MPVRAKFLFAADLGDPISSICLSDVGCMAGTMLGKVWLYSFDTKLHQELAAFSDEGIRGLYLDKDAGYATVGGEGFRGWKRTAPHDTISPVNFRTLDKKTTQNVKHILQRKEWICVLFPTMSVIVSTVSQEQFQCNFKLFDYGSSQEVAPCDFDGKSIVVVDRTFGSPVFRFVSLEQKDPRAQVDVDDLPQGNSMTLAKLWGNDCLAYVAGGCSVYMYDYQKQEPMHRLVGHMSEIIAMDASDPNVIATLSKDAQVFLWNGATGQPLHSFVVPKASFFMGFPAVLAFNGQRLVLSADEGVFLIELDPEDDEKGKA